MDEALRIIISNSANAATEAIHCLRAIQVNSPMVQQRYNRTVEIALSDPNATFTANERSIIANSLALDESEGRGYTLRIRLTESERSELARLADETGVTMSEYVRQRLFK